MSAPTWSHGERLYQLLPALYRIRDLEEGEALRALLSILEAELEAMERHIEDLYENHFIETCAPWAIPYIGDLLGVRLPQSLEETTVYNLRAYVANTLGYRRRKGTATVLEQLARDITGWPARAVEFFQRLVTTQHLDHLRLHSMATVDLREEDGLDRLGGPFERATHIGEVRRIATTQGRYNIPNLGLFLWRLQAYPLHRARARAVKAEWGFTFNPLGMDAPLFNRARTETEITHLAEEIDVPGTLRRRALAADLKAGKDRWFSEPPVLRVWRGHNQVPKEDLCIGDLSTWRQVSDKVVVDPELGRVAFPGPVSEGVYVDYAYGFSGDVGGGPYDRSASIHRWLTRPVTWQVGVTRDLAIRGDGIYASLAEAVHAWNEQPAGTVGIIAIMDSDRYEENLEGARAIQIPENSFLMIVAGQWPADREGRRQVGEFVPRGLRPHVQGRVSVRGTAPADSPDAGGLMVDGLLMEGDLEVLIGNLGHLTLSHCTLYATPRDGHFLKVNSSSVNHAKRNDRLAISLYRTLVVGRVVLAQTVPHIHLEECAVAPITGSALKAPGSEAVIEHCTMLGEVEVRQLEASNTLFTEKIQVERRQTGCMRFSYVPPGSITPRRYRCQPDLALEGARDMKTRERILARVRPVFTSTILGHPAYLQLGSQCPEEIRIGGEDGGEMGVFHFLQQPKRFANLNAALETYLPFGMEVGVFFVT